MAEKVVKYNAANRTVAILCNHQRTVSKNHEQAVKRINDKIRELEWQKIRLKKMILDIDETEKKDNPKYFEELDDLTNDEMNVIVERVIERQKDQAEKKWNRDNEKRKMEKEELLTKADLQEKLDKIEETRKDYLEEIKTGVVRATKGSSVSSLKSKVETVENRIVNTSYQLKDKEDNSEVSLGTSKMNYIDPRLTVVFAKKFNVPIEKLFTKTLRDKFNWAIESTDENWRF